MDNLEEIYNYSINNEDKIKFSKKCGCFYCKRIFNSNEIKQWANDLNGKTALCPYCFVDSVIGDSINIELTEELLETMNKKYFKK